MIKIEKKYLRLRKDTVAQYRRIVTPLFYIKLKTKIFKRYENKSRVLIMPWPFLSAHLLPKGSEVIYKGWNDEKDNIVTDEKLKQRLELENDKVTDNVIHLSA